QCTCRKPRPGLLLQAAQALEVDLTNSIMIGDAWTDLQAGQAAGVGQLALVRTGRGKQQLGLPRP
ncbi:MAG TPA: histidinol phosphate phosphatase, partial [Chloroflexi bacterium]|nr:histidinol phosphate phosphatase [Chloroflexota bacterium]